MNIQPAQRPAFRAAVASNEGVLINQHLGQAAFLRVFELDENGFRLVERRAAPPPGSPQRWPNLAAQIQDCQALLVYSLGAAPLEALTACGVKVYQMEGLIVDALGDFYRGITPRLTAHTRQCNCSGSASAGAGCM